MIKINNKALADYVMFKLDKLENEFTEEELSLITEVNLDRSTYKKDQLNDLVFFPSLKKLTLINFHLDNSSLKLLCDLKFLNDLTFDHCSFETGELITGLNLNSLAFWNCHINNYHFVYIMKDLTHLTIVGGNADLQKIEHLANLEFLQLSFSALENVSHILNLKNLESLYIDNTNIFNINLEGLINLKLLSISENQYHQNKDYLNSLVRKGLVLKKNTVLEWN